MRGRGKREEEERLVFEEVGVIFCQRITFARGTHRPITCEQRVLLTEWGGMNDVLYKLYQVTLKHAHMHTHIQYTQSLAHNTTLAITHVRMHWHARTPTQHDFHPFTHSPCPHTYIHT